MIAPDKDKFSGAAKAFLVTPRPLDRAGRRMLARAMRKDARRGVGWAEDSAFFKANPTRNHRMRLATANEIAVFDSAEGTQAGADGFWWLVVVRQLAPGKRAMTRIYAPLPKWPLAETSERLAHLMFASNVGLHEIVAMIKQYEIPLPRVRRAERGRPDGRLRKSR